MVKMYLLLLQPSPFSSSSFCCSQVLSDLGVTALFVGIFGEILLLYYRLSKIDFSENLEIELQQYQYQCFIVELFLSSKHSAYMWIFIKQPLCNLQWFFVKLRLNKWLSASNTHCTRGFHLCYLA